MVYEKYIEKNGKLYGPYTYHSKRINGKVVSVYHGSKRNFHNNFFWIFAGIFLFGILIFSFIFFNAKISGHAILSSDESGVLSFSLMQGELIPADAKVIFDIDNESLEYSLFELVDDEIVNGDFYVKDKSLIGNGEGFGFIGVKKVYPELDFELEILDKVSDEDSSSEETSEISEQVSEETETQTEVTEQTENQTEVSEDSITEESSEEENSGTEVSEEIPAEVEEETDETQEINEEAETQTDTSEIEEGSSEETGTSLESSSGESVSSESSQSSDLGESSPESSGGEESSGDSSITGAIVKGFLSGTFNIFRTITGQATLELKDTISGEVSFGEAFNYNINEGQIVKIKSGSVKVNGETIDDSAIDVVVIDNKVVVTTDYFAEEQGFGEDYLGDSKKEFLINLSKIGLEPNDNLSMSFVYNNEELVSLGEESFEDETEVNESLQIENVTEIQNVSNESVVSDGLSDEEREILINELGNVSVEITRAEKVRDRIEVTFEVGDYLVEHSYSSELSSDELSEWVNRDKLRLLRDIISELTKVETNATEVDGIVGSYDI